MTGGGGFRETIRTINGVEECGKGGYSGNQAIKGRVDFYIDFSGRLAVDPGGSPADLGC